MVPVLGTVQAGALTTAMEEPDGGYISVKPKTETNELFALRVRGESMKEAGIFSGDIVIVRRQQTAQNGDTVVALIDDEATVKTLRFINGLPQLHPENPDFEPIVPQSGDSFMILGKVIEVRRYLENNL
jgi:repressor LexA